MKSNPTAYRLDVDVASAQGSKLFVALVVLALSVPCWARQAYTSIKTGNWHDPSIWTPAGIPGSGDQALLGNGLTVTCEAGQTCIVGTSPAVSQGGSYAIDCVATNGTGVLNVAGTLQFQGPVRQCNATWTVQAGGSLLHDNTGNHSYHYEWQICAATGFCTNALLRTLGTGWAAGQYVTISNYSGAGNFGGFTNGSTNRTNQIGNFIGASFTPAGGILGGGNIDFAYTYLTNLGVEGGASGVQWLTANLGYSSSRLKMDNVRGTGLSGAFTVGVSYYGADPAATVSITNTSLQSGTTDGIALNLYDATSSSAPDTGARVLSNNLFLGTVGFELGQYTITHNGFISQSPTVVSNSIPGVPIYVPAQSNWLNMLADNLVINNASMTAGAGWLVGNMARTVTLNLASGTDCDSFRGVQPSSGLHYGFVVDGLTDEAWWGSSTTTGCNLVRGAALIPSWSDQKSSPVDIYLRNIVSLPRVNNPNGFNYSPAHNTLIANETTAPGSGNIHYHIWNVVVPACSSRTCGIVDFEANTGAYGQIAEVVNSITYGIGTAVSSARFVVSPGGTGPTAAGSIAVADYNDYWNTTNIGQTLYDYSASIYQNWAAVGSHDQNVNPQFVDITRNMITWAATAPRNSTETYQTIQSHWTAYKTAAWDSNWDWTNNSYGGDPTPNCAPACYYDWVIAGFTATNTALKGQGFGGADVGLMAPTPRRHPPAQWRR